MRDLTLMAFMDELSKISADAAAATGGNAAAPLGAKSGMGSNAMVTSASKSSSGLSAAKPAANPLAKPQAAKPTNYSIVHSTAPSAAFGAPSSKMTPPPPVRT
jgi:hypothetical protein